MKGQVKLISAMLIFGSIGLFVKNIHLSSSEIALLRGVIGSIFLLAFSLLIKQKPSLSAVKANIILLLFSGAALGFNWIFLFEAYRYTTISNATISYYFAPVIVLVLAPFILKEKLTPVKIISLFLAMAGLILVVNNGGNGLDGSYNHTVGVLYGLLAAILYAGVILMNKFIKHLSGFETTLIQLMMASLVLAPYVYIKEGLAFSGLNSQSLVLILIVGIIHTGFAYFLYFGAIKELKGQTIAVFSYIDPISAVIFSFLFLGESMGILQIIGGILVLGSSFLSENEKKLSFKIRT
ncbi:DMT family transporter [Niallia sp. Krafla_26]|uniref:DMT family transporter n=1 Tax=Niallia sp. Krafla_26 TaxID=3064703 RepID=UPI003D185CF0